MSPEMLRILFVLFTVWGVAVAIKAAGALQRKEPYVFGMWDGGMLRVGKRINRTGQWIKLVVGIAMAIACFGLVAAWIPVKTASGLIVSSAVAGIISDFVNADES